LLFKKGEVLAELHIPADAKPAEIFKTIYLAVADPEASRVRALAIAKNMLPHPVTGNYGSADLDNMFGAVDQIRARQGVVTVRAVAAGDTYTVGPLVIEIQVGEGSGPEA